MPERTRGSGSRTALWRILAVVVRKRQRISCETAIVPSDSDEIEDPTSCEEIADSAGPAAAKSTAAPKGAPRGPPPPVPRNGPPPLAPCRIRLNRMAGRYHEWPREELLAWVEWMCQEEELPSRAQVEVLPLLSTFQPWQHLLWLR